MSHSVGHIFFLLPLLLLLRAVTAQDLVDQDIAYGLTFTTALWRNNVITSGRTPALPSSAFGKIPVYRYFGFRATILSW